MSALAAPGAAAAAAPRAAAVPGPVPSADHAVAALWGLAASGLFIVYETTMPFAFQFTSAQLAASWARAAIVPFATPAGLRFGLSDIVGNIVLFVPFGFFLALSPLLIRRGAARPWLLVAAMGAASALIETIQLFSPLRYTQTSDVITNTLGGAAGVWLAAQGGRFWFDRAVGALLRRLRDEPQALIVLGLTAAILFGSLLPFDVSISRAFLLKHLREIDLHVLSTGGPPGTRLEAATGLLKRAWLFSFWGAAAAHWLAGQARARRAFLTALGAGAALAVAAEACQIVIVSRTLDPFAPLAGIVGAAAGAAVALWGRRAGLGGRALLALSLVAYGCYLALDLVSPLDPAVVQALLRGEAPPTRALLFDPVPLRQASDASRMVTLGRWIAQAARFAPLGALLCLGIRSRPRRWLAAAAVVAAALGLELAEGWIGLGPGEATDVLMVCAGLLVGALVAARWRSWAGAVPRAPSAAGPRSQEEE